MNTFIIHHRCGTGYYGFLHLIGTHKIKEIDPLIIILMAIESLSDLFACLKSFENLPSLFCFPSHHETGLVYKLVVDELLILFENCNIINPLKIVQNTLINGVYSLQQVADPPPNTTVALFHFHLGSWSMV